MVTKIFTETTHTKENNAMKNKVYKTIVL